MKREEAKAIAQDFIEHHDNRVATHVIWAVEALLQELSRYERIEKEIADSWKAAGKLVDFWAVPEKKI